MKLGYVVLSACAAVAVAGCGGDESRVEQSGAPTSAAAGDDLGKAYAVAKASDGSAIGTLRFTEVAVAPPECFDPDDAPGPKTLAIRIEVTNAGTLKLDASGDLMQVNDSGGFTQDAKSPSISSRCEQQWLPLADAPTPGKAAGWVFLNSPVPDPTAVVFTPLVWSGKATLGSSAEDLKNLSVVATYPAQIVVKLPVTITPAAAPVPAAATTEPEPTTTQAPTAPTTVAAPPAPREGNACDPDSDGWAKDASGQQLYCTYAGAPTPRWVASLPLIGVRRIGQPCEGYDYVAQTASGQPLMCTWDPIKQDGSNSWQPGP